MSDSGTPPETRPTPLRRNPPLSLLLATGLESVPMHQIEDAIVHGGKIELSHLPFLDGQRVRVVITEQDAAASKPLSIDEVRRQLRGGVAHFDDPFEPMIPGGDWEMLK